MTQKYQKVSKNRTEKYQNKFLNKLSTGWSKVKCATDNNVSQWSIEIVNKKEVVDLSNIKPIEVIQIDPLLIELIQLSLTGKTIKSNGSFKMYKNQGGLQNLCSMIPNQPAPKREKKLELIFGNSGKS